MVENVVRFVLRKTIQVTLRRLIWCEVGDQRQGLHNPKSTTPSERQQRSKVIEQRFLSSHFLRRNETRIPLLARTVLLLCHRIYQAPNKNGHGVSIS